MRERQTSIADALMAGRALLDGRYRLDALLRRSGATTIHVAMHRNGSTAWLKLPVSRDVPAPDEMLLREASIANTLGSPLVVRDDGTTPEGVPYLVLDPPEADSVAELRARGKTGVRLPLARVMTAGDALARVVASLHALGWASGGLADEDILVFANGDIALLDLHALTPTTAPGAIATDVKRVMRVLSALVADVADASGPAAKSSRALIDGALAAAYPDVTALQAAWRAAAPEPIALPGRIRQGSLADISSAKLLAAPSTPQSMSIGDDFHPHKPAPPPPRDPDGSVIGYLRSGGLPSSPPPGPVGPRERAVMYDPLSKVADMPRLVQATSRGSDTGARAKLSRPLVVAAVVAPLMAVVTGVVFLIAAGTSTGTGGASATRRGPSSSAFEANTAVAAADPLPVAPVPKASPPASIEAAPSASAPPAAASDDDELQLTTMLRTDNAPADRDVFLDGNAIGKTPLEATVPCGRHTLQMVAGAPKQAVELPCGGARVVRYDAKGHWSIKAE